MEAKAVNHVFQNLEANIRCILTLPRGPVEPTILSLSQNDSGVSSSAFGSLLAPCGVCAGNVFVRSLPTFASAGDPLQFDLTLSNDSPYHALAEREIAVASIAVHAHVDVFLERKRESHHPIVLRTTLTSSSSSSLIKSSSGSSSSGGSVSSVSVSVSVSVDIPDDSQMGDEIVIRNVFFAGQAVTTCTTGCETGCETECVAGAEKQALPFRVPVWLHLKGATNKSMSTRMSTPVISLDGTLYAANVCSNDVLVFSADGTPLPPLHLKDMGLSRYTRSAAFVDGLVDGDGTEAKGTLLLADANGADSKLVAVDAASRAVRWSAELGGDCGGIAVLPAQGVVITSATWLRRLRVHRLSDGTRIASVAVDCPAFLAADPTTATVFVSNSQGKVSTFRWNGANLVFDGFIEAAGATDNWRPIVIMPQASGQCTSFLVVGNISCSNLRVFLLPDRRLVHTHELKGIDVMGLAADPSGTALAVPDGASNAIHVMPWPLPGMKTE